MICSYLNLVLGYQVIRSIRSRTFKRYIGSPLCVILQRPVCARPTLVRTVVGVWGVPTGTRVSVVTTTGETTVNW